VKRNPVRNWTVISAGHVDEAAVVALDADHDLGGGAGAGRMPTPLGRAVTDAGFDPDQARNMLHAIQADIARLPIRLRHGRFSQSELVIQLANDVVRPRRCSGRVDRRC